MYSIPPRKWRDGARRYLRAKPKVFLSRFGSIVAEVVTVDMSGGEPRVLHVACAADAGLAVNPDGFEAQMESGIIYGLTAAL